MTALSKNVSPYDQMENKCRFLSKVERITEILLLWAKINLTAKVESLIYTLYFILIILSWKMVPLKDNQNWIRKSQKTTRFEIIRLVLTTVLISFRFEKINQMKLSYHFTTSKNCQKQEHNRVFVHCGVHAAGLAGIAATHMMGQREIRDSSRPHMYMCAPGVHQASWTALPTAPPHSRRPPNTYILLRHIFCYIAYIVLCPSSSMYIMTSCISYVHSTYILHTLFYVELVVIE